MIKRKVDLEVTLTPDEIAQEFCNMGSDEQVVFLNTVAEIVARWEKPFCVQLQAVTDDPHLTNDARHVMHQFGEYAPKQ